VRLADPAEAVTILSAVFGLLLIFLPVSFPRMIVTNWQQGRLTPLMMAFTLLLDTFLYLRAAHLMSAKPGVVASACLGSLPLLIVGGLSLLLQSAVTLTLSTDLPNLLGRTSEEILAHTYLALVAAVFLPFIVIRFLQQFRAPHL
jgi:ABC-type Fe3+ transport system permease subunit